MGSKLRREVWVRGRDLGIISDKFEIKSSKENMYNKKKKTEKRTLGMPVFCE